VQVEPKQARHQRFTVMAKTDRDLRPDIFRLAASSGWELYELHEQSATLEEVFRTLTTEAGGPEGTTGRDASPDRPNRKVGR
jgi:hypothetical protein